MDQSSVLVFQHRQVFSQDVCELDAELSRDVFFVKIKTKM